MVSKTENSMCANGLGMNENSDEEISKARLTVADNTYRVIGVPLRETMGHDDVTVAEVKDCEYLLDALGLL